MKLSFERMWSSEIVIKFLLTERWGFDIFIDREWGFEIIMKLSSAENGIPKLS